MMFSVPSLLMTCPKNLACFSDFNTELSAVSALLSTSSLVVLSMYDNLCIFLINHISCCIDDIHSDIVDGSLPYVSIGNTM